MFSDHPVHPALISPDTFAQVGARMASRGPRSTGRHVVRTRHRYVLKGLVYCAACGRRMQGSWNHDQAHYRCRYPNEYALANTLDHPLSAYVRERPLVEPLDAWLAQAFAPDQIEHTLAALADAQPDLAPEADAARATITACDRKLARHRQASKPAPTRRWSPAGCAKRNRNARWPKHASPSSPARVTRRSG